MFIIELLIFLSKILLGSIYAMIMGYILGYMITAGITQAKIQEIKKQFKTKSNGKKEKE